MSTLQQLFSSDLVHHLGWMLLHSVWLMALPAMLLALVLVALPKRFSHMRYLASIVTLVLMLACFALSAWFVPDRAAFEIAEALAPGLGSPAALTDPIALSAEPPAFAIDDFPTAPIADGPGVDVDPAAPSTTDWVVPDSPPASGVAASDDPTAPTPADAAASDLSWYEHAAQWASPWAARAVPVWMIGVIVLGLWHLGGLIAVHRLRSIGTRPAPADLAERMQALINQMGIRRPVSLLESVVVQVPAVIGWVRPIILLPAGALAGFTPQQVEAILAHELAHIRRHDYLINLIQTAIVTLLFHHPAVWWVARVIHTERECCCDDIVVRLTKHRLDYAKALARMAQMHSAAPRLAMAADNGSLFERIRRLARLDDAPGVSPKAWLAGLALMLAAIALPMTLTWGQQADATTADRQLDDSIDPASSEADADAGAPSDTDPQPSPTPTVLDVLLTQAGIELDPAKGIADRGDPRLKSLWFAPPPSRGGKVLYQFARGVEQVYHGQDGTVHLNTRQSVFFIQQGENERGEPLYFGPFDSDINQTLGKAPQIIEATDGVLIQVIDAAVGEDQQAMEACLFDVYPSLTTRAVFPRRLLAQLDIKDWEQEPALPIVSRFSVMDFHVVLLRNKPGVREPYTAVILAHDGERWGLFNVRSVAAPSANTQDYRTEQLELEDYNDELSWMKYQSTGLLPFPNLGSRSWGPGEKIDAMTHVDITVDARGTLATHFYSQRSEFLYGLDYSIIQRHGEGNDTFAIQPNDVVVRQRSGNVGLTTMKDHQIVLPSGATIREQGGALVIEEQSTSERRLKPGQRIRVDYKNNYAIEVIDRPDDQALLDQLAQGMSREQVEAVLGKPNSHTDRRLGWRWYGTPPALDPAEVRYTPGAIAVRFEKDRLIDKKLSPALAAELVQAQPEKVDVPADTARAILGRWYGQFVDSRYMPADMWCVWEFREDGKNSFTRGMVGPDGEIDPANGESMVTDYKIDDQGRLLLYIPGEKTKVCPFEIRGGTVYISVDEPNDFVFTREPNPEAFKKEREAARIERASHRVQSQLINLHNQWRRQSVGADKRQPTGLAQLAASNPSMVLTPLRPDITLPEQYDDWEPGRQNEWLHDNAGFVYLPVPIAGEIIDALPPGHVLLFERPTPGRAELYAARVDEQGNIGFAFDPIPVEQLDAILKEQTGQGLEAYTLKPAAEEHAKPLRVTIPDIDEPRDADQPRVLDLRSGELLKLPDNADQLGGTALAKHYTDLGRGDLIYERASGTVALIVLRGSKVYPAFKAEPFYVKKIERDDRYAVYMLKPGGQLLRIQTPEGDQYHIKVLSHLEEGGVEIAYTRTPASEKPAEGADENAAAIENFTAEQKAASTANMKKLYAALILLADFKGDTYPKALGEAVANNLLKPETVLAPWSGVEVPDGFADMPDAERSDWAGRHTSYIYLLPGQAYKVNGSRALLVELPWINDMPDLGVCFEDGSVKRMPYAEADKLVKQQTGRDLDGWAKAMGRGQQQKVEPVDAIQYARVKMLGVWYLAKRGDEFKALFGIEPKGLCGIHIRGDGVVTPIIDGQYDVMRDAAYTSPAGFEGSILNLERHMQPGARIAGADPIKRSWVIGYTEEGALSIGDGLGDSVLSYYTRNPPKDAVVAGKQALLGKWYVQMENNTYLRADEQAEDLPTLAISEQGDSLLMNFRESSKAEDQTQRLLVELLDNPPRLRMKPDVADEREPVELRYAVIGDTLVIIDRDPDQRTGPVLLCRTARGTDAIHARKQITVDLSGETLGETKRRGESVQRLKLIGLALLKYQDEHNGMTPTSLGELYASGAMKNIDEPIKTLLSPFDEGLVIPDAEPEGGWAKWIDTYSGFVLVEPGMKLADIKHPAETVLLIDLAYAQGGKRATLAFADGHVVMSSYEGADAWLKPQTGKELKALFKQHGRVLKGGDQPKPEPGAALPGEADRITIHELSYFEDGGTLGVDFTNATGKRMKIAIDARIARFIQEDNTHLRLYVGAMHPEDQGAKLVDQDSDMERTVFTLLRGWVDQRFTAEQIKQFQQTDIDALTQEQLWARRIVDQLEAVRRYRQMQAFAVYPASFDKPEGWQAAEVKVPGEERPVYYTRGDALFTLGDVVTARMVEDQLGHPALKFTVSEQAAQRLEQFTRAHLNEPLLIMIDHKPVSAPVIRDVLRDKVMISSGQDDAEVMFKAVIEALQPEPGEPDADGKDAGASVDRARFIGTWATPREAADGGPSYVVVDLPENGTWLYALVWGTLDKPTAVKVESFGKTWDAVQTPPVFVTNDEGKRPDQVYDLRLRLDGQSLLSLGEILPKGDKAFEAFNFQSILSTETYQRVGVAQRKPLLEMLERAYALKANAIKQHTDGRGQVDDWAVGMEVLSQMPVKAYGRGPLVWMYESLINSNRKDSRIGDAMLAIANLYGSIKTPEMGITPDREEAKRWIERAAKQSPEGSPAWISARFALASWLPMDDPAGSRKLLHEIKAQAKGDSLTLLRVEYETMNTYLQEQDWDNAVAHAATALRWYQDAERIPEDPLKKTDADMKLRETARIIVSRLKSAQIPAAQRDTFIQRLRDANGFLIEDALKPNDQFRQPAGQQVPNVEVPDDKLTWGPPINGLRIRMIQPDKPFEVGEKPTVQVVLQNTSKQPVVWGKTSLLLMVPGLAPQPKTYAIWGRDQDIAFANGGRLATADEVSKQMGIGHNDFKGDDPFPGFVYLAPGAQATMTFHYPKPIDKPGRYQVECQETRFDNVAPLPEEMLTCPPIVFSFVEEGKNAPPEEDPTHWPEGEWGPATLGMQVRLNSNSFLNPGKLPGLHIDLRNFGKQKMRFIKGMEKFEIRVDGTWYRPTVFKTSDVKVYPFAPGNRWEDIRFVPFDQFSWQDDKGNKLVFGPGQHTIHIAVYVDPQDEGFGNPARLISNGIKLGDPGQPAEPELGAIGEGVITMRKIDMWRDGGTIGMKFDWPNGREAMIAFDHRGAYNTIENKTKGRLFVGAMHPEHGAELVPEDGEAEKIILGALRDWLEDHFTAPQLEIIRAGHDRRDWTQNHRWAASIMDQLETYANGKAYRASVARLAGYVAYFKKPHDRVYKVTVPGDDQPVYREPWAVFHFNDITRATRQAEEQGNAVVVLDLNESGASRLRVSTAQHVNQPLVITIDGKPVAAPVVRDRLTTSIQVTGLSDEQIDALIEAVEEHIKEEAELALP